MKIDVQVLGKVCLVSPQGNIKLGETDLVLRETITLGSKKVTINWFSIWPGSAIWIAPDSEKSSPP